MKTVLVIVIGLVFVYFVTQCKIWLTAAFAIGLLGCLSNRCAAIIDFLWMKLAALLGLIVPNILLALVFYLFLTPIALLSRLGKKDALMLKNKYPTMFKVYDRKFDKSYFEKIF